MDLALNNLQRVIYHKTQPTNIEVIALETGVIQTKKEYTHTHGILL